MGLGIPPLKMKILLESNPRKSIICVLRFGPNVVMTLAGYRPKIIEILNYALNTKRNILGGLTSSKSCVSHISNVILGFQCFWACSPRASS